MLLSYFFSSPKTWNKNANLENLKFSSVSRSVEPPPLKEWSNTKLSTVVHQCICLREREVEFRKDILAKCYYVVLCLRIYVVISYHHYCRVLLKFSGTGWWKFLTWYATLFQRLIYDSIILVFLCIIVRLDHISHSVSQSKFLVRWSKVIWDRAVYTNNCLVVLWY